MKTIPVTSTPRSVQLYAFAREFADTCPLSLGQEIVLTGSTSRGRADEFSDLEINFYVNEEISLQERDAWFRQIGAEQVRSKSTGSMLDSKFLYRGVWIEAVWEQVDGFEKTLSEIAAGHVLDHNKLVLADIINKAVPLRTVGYLDKWQTWLQEYPEGLQQKLIGAVLGAWRSHHSPVYLLLRGDYFTLSQRLQNDLYNVFRLLFAVNKQWEPFWKWKAEMCESLTVQPGSLSERVDRILLAPPEERVQVCLELILDSLALAADVHEDVAEAQRVIGGYLQKLQQSV